MKLLRLKDGSAWPFFWIRSRYDVQYSNPVLEPHIIISINTPGDPAADLIMNCYTLDTQVLFFHDLDQAPGEAFRKVYGRPTLFGEKHAAEIHKFVAKNIAKGAVKSIVVHCDMGISRSAAVGAALSKWLNGTDEGFFGYGKYPRRFSTRCLAPNMLVYRTLLNYLERREATEEV